jgi:hypothetical protein
MTDSDGALLWQIIDRVRAVAGGELTASVDAFRIELEALDDQALLEVDAGFSRAMQRAYDHDLWAAAYLIHGGCGDDAFWDFRAGLIALGREVFDAALANPDLLADIEDIEDRTLFEGFQYVPGKLVEQRGLTRMGGGHSSGSPSGTRWNEDDTAALQKRFPRLTARFSWL